MKPPFQKDRKLDLSSLQDWPRKVREDEAAAVEKDVDKCPYCSSKKIVKRGMETDTPLQVLAGVEIQ